MPIPQNERERAKEQVTSSAAAMTLEALLAIIGSGYLDTSEAIDAFRLGTERAFTYARKRSAEEAGDASGPGAAGA